MDKRKQLRIINDLLDQCGDCPKRFIQNVHPDKLHAGCPLYQQLRTEGKKAWAQEPVSRRGGRKKFELSTTEYFSMREKGLNDEDIALEKEVNSTTLRTWKRKNSIRTKKMKPKGYTVIDPKLYEQLVSNGLNSKQIMNRLGVTRGQLNYFKRTHDYPLGRQPKAISSDEDVLQALINNKSYWWIQKHLRCGRARADRIAEKHGIKR